MPLRSIPPRLTRFAARLHYRMWWARSVTLGVRVIVLEEDRVFLVRHSYMPGWYLPGGGVDRGESAETAAVRELREEGGLVATERPSLHGFYRNGRRDHVACYVVHGFMRDSPPRLPDWEIAETGFFALDALPVGVTGATRARLAELLAGQTISQDW